MTAADLIKLVREEAAKRPDNVYHVDARFCSYSEGVCSDGSCGCLFGQLLRPRFPNAAWELVDTQRLLSVLDQLFIRGTADEMEWLARVQRKQDGLLSWKKCVEDADKEIPGVTK